MSISATVRFKVHEHKDIQTVFNMHSRCAHGAIIEVRFNDAVRHMYAAIIVRSMCPKPLERSAS